jgi:hypothetical protein
MNTASLIALGEGRSGLADIWARLTLRRAAWWRAPNSPGHSYFNRSVSLLTLRKPRPP